MNTQSTFRRAAYPSWRPACSRNEARHTHTGRGWCFDTAGCAGTGRPMSVTVYSTARGPAVSVARPRRVP
eukprot:4194353-Prymnesium_polylepis.1